ncbi:glycosyltransferase [Fodinibius saliphilus]|uniref:glycosyltransferase n=1 Tax=Fodinibius saliphilus TaxID=1920650 RepID=UPI00110852AB|nr:glycosyltransferase [Fodinibius saliphilus]
MKILQINSSVNTTSTGRIAEEIGQALQKQGHESFIASKKVGPGGSTSNLIHLGNKYDEYAHALKTRLFDRHGFGSKRTTQAFLRKLKEISPDVIGLHNLHGYYLNVEGLFNYLKEVQKPVVWTLHDCWPFTGHCSFFDYVSCEKWKTECRNCPLSDKYPASWFMDQSRRNFYHKKKLFNGIQDLTIITPSQWLATLVKQSFLGGYAVEVINNGIDLEKFWPTNADNINNRYNLFGKKVLLGVASVWDRRKGLKYFLELSKKLDDSFKIILVGLPEVEINRLPENIIGIQRTESLEELVSFYSVADVFVNPTLVDNFPTTNLEALACGTPVITFDTGGSPESIDEDTGMVVEKGNLKKLLEAIKVVCSKSERYREACRNRAITHYDKKERYYDYVNLYEKTLVKKHALK